MSQNNLTNGGPHSNDGGFDVTGIKAIADALSVSTPMKSLK